MNRNCKLLIRTIAMVCFLGYFAAYSQKSDISITIDLEKREILTFVKLSGLPSGVDILWQQKIPKGTHFSSSSNSQNTDGKMIVLSFSRHLHASTMSFSFVCKADSIGEEISWGESALIYTDAESQEQVINFSAKTYIIAECLSNFAKPIEQPIANQDNAKDSLQNTIVVAVTPNADIDTNTDIISDAENLINNDEEVISVNEDIVENTENEAQPIENLINDDEAEIPVNENIVENTENEAPTIENLINNDEAEIPVNENIVENTENGAQPIENLINNDEEVISVNEDIVENTENETPTTENLINDEEKEDVSIIEPEKKNDETTENQTISVNTQEIQNETSEKIGYYIQLFALKNKRTIPDVRKLVYAHENDKIVERQKNVLFVYLVGPFSSKEEADEKLEYYKKYAEGSFVTKM